MQFLKGRKVKINNLYANKINLFSIKNSENIHFRVMYCCNGLMKLLIIIIFRRMFVIKYKKVAIFFYLSINHLYLKTIIYQISLMKKINLLRVFALVSTLLIFSCTTDYEPVDPTVSLNPVTPAQPASFKVNFSGQTFVADDTNANIANGLISITALSQLESFTLRVTGTSEGVYLLSNTNTITYSAGNGQPLFSSTNPDNTTASNGQITITSINTAKKTISGTFNFTGYYKEGNVTTTKEFTVGTFTNLPFVTN